MTDILGPANAANTVTTRIAETRVFPTTDSWFKPCSTPAAQDGTQVQAAFLNGLLAKLRAISRGNGLKNDGVTPIIPDVDSNDAILLGAILQLIQRGQANYVVDTGTADAIVVAPTPALVEYEFGLRLLVLKNPLVGANATKTPTINAGLGALPIVKCDGSALGIGDLKKGGLFEVELNGPSYARLVPILTISDVLALIPTVTRTNLTGNLTVYVRTDGSDSNNGLTNSPTGALATISGAWKAISQLYNFNGYTVTIQLGIPGTYVGASFANYGVSGSVKLLGSTSIPASYIITPSGSQGSCISAQINAVYVQGVTLQNNTINNVYMCWAFSGGVITLDTVNFNLLGASLPGTSLIVADIGGQINIVNQININGGGATVNSAVYVPAGGQFLGTFASLPAAVSVSNITFTTAFHFVFNGVSRWTASSIVFSSSNVSGPEYLVAANGVINTNGAGANYFPGSTTIPPQSGGQYL